MNNTRDIFAHIAVRARTGRFSCKESNVANTSVSEPTTKNFFGIELETINSVPFEQLTEEELQLMLRDARSEKTNSIHRGTKE